MPIPAEFFAESLYAQERWFLDDVIELDRESGRIVGLTETTSLGSFVEAQRPWPGQPKHVPGVVMVQITGTLGNIHAVCVLGLKMSEGWVGFGTHIHEAKFRGLGRIGPPLRCELEIERVRQLRGQFFVTYRFNFSQDAKTIYRSRQSAHWSRAESPEG